MTGRILIVDDEQAMCEMLHDDLSSRGCEVAWQTSPQQGFDDFMRGSFDAVITDLKMPALGGIDLCHRLVENRPDVPVIVITAFGSMETAINAIRAGAYDFVTKPIELDMLAIVVERALRHRSLQEQVRLLKANRRRADGLDGFIGQSESMGKLYDQIERLSDQQVPVLITGESGTGKELIAEALHQHSPRRHGPFVPVNCATLPRMLLESELFGHSQGAFTDASVRREGLFYEARGGTLFLDEIGEIPLELQPKLLRALETGCIRPVGANREIRCDVRVLAATNRDLEAAVEAGQFREDLFFRVNVVRIEAPPLRRRGADILLLAKHFVDQIARRSGRAGGGFSPKVAEKLLSYRWPGNVRELRNAMESAMALTRFDQLAVEDLPEKIRDDQPSTVLPSSEAPEKLLPLDVIERRYVQHVLDAVDGNKSVAARILELDRRTLYRKLERWDMQSPS